MSGFPTLFTEVAVETRGTRAASVDVVTGSSIKAYAGVSAAVAIVTWQACFIKEKQQLNNVGLDIIRCMLGVFAIKMGYYYGDLTDYQINPFRVG